MIRQIQANNQRWRKIEKQKYLLNNSNEFEPKWREKEIKLEIITNEIAQNNDKLRNYELEKKQYNFKKMIIQKNQVIFD